MFTATPGQSGSNELTILCEADTARLGDIPPDDLRWKLVKPDGTYPMFKDDPANVEETWGQGEDNTSTTPPTKYGKGPTATATFATLPDKNDSFGKKVAILYQKIGDDFEGKELARTEFEVFWPKCAAGVASSSCCDKSDISRCRNPDFKFALSGTTVPYWFRYWSQIEAVGKTAIVHNIPLVWEATPGGKEDYMGWTYGRREAVQKVAVGNMAAGKNLSEGDKSKATGNQGVDCFLETVLHEYQHVDNWLTANSHNDYDDDWLADKFEVSRDVNCDGVYPTVELDDNGVNYLLSGIELNYGKNNRDPANPVRDSEEQVVAFLKVLTTSPMNGGAVNSWGHLVHTYSDCDKSTGFPLATVPSVPFYKYSREGYSWFTHSPYGGTDYDDEHDVAYCKEEAWSPGTADDFDWGAPGKKYSTPF